MPEFTEYAPGMPCWTDVTSTDLPRSVEFYRALFGWEAEVAPQPEAGGYTMFSKNGKYVAAGSPPQQEGIPPARSSVSGRPASTSARSSRTSPEPSSGTSARRPTLQPRTSSTARSSATKST